jgi:hypothetical protein
MSDASASFRERGGASRMPVRFDERLSRIRDLDAVGIDLDQRPCTHCRQVLMHQSVGKHLAQGKLRNHGDGPADAGDDLLMRRHDRQQGPEHGLKAGRIARGGGMFFERPELVRAAVAHDPHSLASQRGRGAQIARKCEHREVGDVIATLQIGNDQLLANQTVENRRIADRAWFSKQFEKRANVEQRQDVPGRGAPYGHCALEGVPAGGEPQGPLLVGKVRELAFVRPVRTQATPLNRTGFW